MYNTSRITWTSIKSNLVTGFLFGLLAVLLYITKNGSIFGLDIKAVVDIFTLAFIAVVVSFLQSLFTNPQTGKFAGAVKIK